jgi:hypothetical protein
MRIFPLLGAIGTAGILLSVYHFTTPDVPPMQQPVLSQLVPEPTQLSATNQRQQEQHTDVSALPGGNSSKVKGAADRNDASLAETGAPVISDAALPATSAPPAETGAKYKRVLATVFWTGEAAGRDNGFISNAASAWDSAWQEHFGGVDDPNRRCGYAPCAFAPKENPFYFALPYNDLDEAGSRKASAKDIPWFAERSERKSVVKNSWLEIRYQNARCYAQWEDVGPFESDDFDYVFGTAPPRNTDGLGAGLDISPAVRDCLGLKSNDVVRWKFVSEHAVPAGPWKEIVTVSDVSW